MGDIQGCLDALRRLLAAAGFRAGSDVLHPVGDLVSKGPDSEGVLTLAMDLGAEAVLGNHDLAWLRDGCIRDPQKRGWLASQPIVRVLENLDVILVHAGLHPAWTEERLNTLSDEDVDFAVTVRYCDAQGRRPAADWPPPSLPYRPWDAFYQGDKRVVFGHWARRGLVRAEKVLGLDTGCVYGGKLSGWNAEEDRIVQVPGLEQ